MKVRIRKKNAQAGVDTASKLIVSVHVTQNPNDKQVRGFKSFLLRGFEAVKGEWNLVCMAYNIKRPHVLTG